MRHVSPIGVTLVKKFEGLRTKPYRCPAGRWTIGHGATVAGDGRQVTPVTPAITEEEAARLLARDLDVAAQGVLRLVTMPLTDRQLDALASFAFNVGLGRFEHSTLRALVNAGNHAAIPAELVKWTRANGRILPGLVQRRKAEAALYGGPPLPNPNTA